MPDHTTKRVPVAALKERPGNPPRRVKAARRNKSLERSILEIGLQYPILVRKGTMNIVDGHRRLAAVRNLGWTDVPVIETSSDDDAAVYRDVNATAVHLSGNDVLHLYLNDPAALTQRQRSYHEHAETQLGKAILQTLLQRGFGLNFYRVAKQLAIYCDLDNPAFLKAAIKWMLKFGSAALKSSIELRVPPRNLEKAIKKVTQLMPTYKVADES